MFNGGRATYLSGNLVVDAAADPGVDNAVSSAVDPTVDRAFDRTATIVENDYGNLFSHLGPIRSR
jgi:hypothetical protein